MHNGNAGLSRRGKGVFIKKSCVVYQFYNGSVNVNLNLVITELLLQ